MDIQTIISDMNLLNYSKQQHRMLISIKKNAAMMQIYNASWLVLDSGVTLNICHFLEWYQELNTVACIRNVSLLKSHPRKIHYLFSVHLYVVQEELEIKAKDLKFSLLTRMRQRYMEEELMYDPLEKKHT